MAYKVKVKYDTNTIIDDISQDTTWSKTLSTSNKLMSGNISVECYKGSRLPSGYTEVKYITFDGTQYIRTGVQSTDINRIVYKFNPSSTTSDVHLVCSTRSDTSGHYRIYCAINKNAFYYGYNSTSYLDTPVGTCYPNSIYEVDAYIGDNSQYLKVNDITLITTSIAMHTSSVENIIGGWNGNGDMSPQYSGRLYEIKAYKDPTLVFDFVPCKDSSNAVGFYDLISDSFKQKAVGNALVAGPEV